MAITCLIYLVLYCLVHIQASKAYKRQILTPSEPIMTPIYSSNQRILPLTISHHHQTCTLASHPYSAPVPVMMAVYPPQAPPLPADMNYIDRVTPNSYAKKYSSLSNERF